MLVSPFFYQILNWDTVSKAATPNSLAAIPFFASHREESDSHKHLREISAQLIKTKDYIPGVASLLNYGSQIACSYQLVIPSPFRVVTATLATLHSTLVPAFILSFFHKLLHLLQHLASSPSTLFLKATDLAFLYGLFAAFTSVTFHGARELLEKLHLPDSRLTLIEVAISSPVIGYLCRLSTVRQIANLWSAYQLSPAIQLTAQRPLAYAQLLRTHKHFVQEASGKHLQAFEAELTSWNPFVRLSTERKLRQFAVIFAPQAKRFCDNQLLGLSENLLAFAAMAATPLPVVSSLFWIFSTTSGLMQTHHKQLSNIKVEPF